MSRLELGEGLQFLDPWSRKCIELYFGFHGREFSTAEIGRHYRLPAHRIVTTLKKAKQHLKRIVDPETSKSLTTPVPCILDCSIEEHEFPPGITIDADEIQNAPLESGCYVWIDSWTGEVLRIGKAVSIRQRLKTYLRPHDYASIEFKTWRGNSPLARFQIVFWLLKPIYYSEFERWLLKSYRPRFNICHGAMKRRRQA